MNAFAPSFLFVSSVLMALSSAACSSGAAPSPRPGAELQPTPIAPEHRAESIVWKATSARIEMTSFGYFSGSSGYSKSRADLTSEQAAALAGLRAVPTTPAQPVEDAVSYRITIVDDDGSIQQYRAAQGDVLDGDESSDASAYPTILMDSLSPFLATIHCLSASETRGWQGAGSAPPWPPAATGPTLSSDLACENGVFLPHTCVDLGLRFTVDKPGQYTVSAVDCFNELTLVLFTADGVTQLATSPQGTAGACPSVSYRFDGAGTYALKLEDRVATGCDGSGSTAGDMALVVSYAP